MGFLLVYLVAGVISVIEENLQQWSLAGARGVCYLLAPVPPTA